MRIWTAPRLARASSGTAKSNARYVRLFVGSFLLLAFLALPPDGAGSLEAVPAYRTDLHTTALQWASDESSPASAVERLLVSQELDAPFPFSALAVHWQGSLPEGAAAQFEARFRRGESWGSWQPLGQGPSHPQSMEGWRVTQLLHTSEAEGTQIRVALGSYAQQFPELAQAELHLLRALETGRRYVAHSVPPVLAAERVGKPPVVTRAQWGADETLGLERDGSGRTVRVWEPEYQPITHIVLHHTAGPNLCAATDVVCQRQSVEMVNIIYYYHAEVLGWGDIGYNAIVGYDGRIYAGRRGSAAAASDPLGEPVVGGHVFGYNYGTYGIAIMGDFTEVPLPPHQRRSLVDVLGWALTAPSLSPKPLDPTEVASLTRRDGSLPQQAPRMLTHGDLDATQDPGPFFFAILGDLRHEVLGRTLWPPVHLDTEARPTTTGATFLGTIRNHAPEAVADFRVRVAVPAGARLVDSWAGTRGSNRGDFDGREVSWTAPDTTLAPYARHGPFAVELAWPEDTRREDVAVHFWMTFHHPLLGSATSSAVVPLLPNEIIVDSNRDLDRIEIVGVWPTSTNVFGYYYSGYRPNAPGNGSERLTWRVDIPIAGSYEVFAWWTAAEDRAANAPYSVAHADGSTTVRVDQTQGGSRWQSLGVYRFSAASARVTLTDDADGYVVADAVRFVRR